jgi:hypothetical protein
MLLKIDWTYNPQKSSESQMGPIGTSPQQFA